MTITPTRRSVLAMGAGTLAALGLPAFAQPALAQDDLLRQLTHDPFIPARGNPDGKLTIVKFADYQCGYCRRYYPQVMEIVKADSRLRFVMRDFTVYGESSADAARMVRAAAEQGRHAQAQDAMFALSSRLNARLTRQTLEKAGVNIGQAEKWTSANSARLDAMLDDSAMIARQIGLRGTPGYVIGHTMIPGVIEREAMRGVIATEIART